MQFSASDFSTMYRPSRCLGRVFHQRNKTPAAKASAWEEVLTDLGIRHETAHVGTFPEFVDLRSGVPDDRIVATKRAVESRQPVIYQGVLRAAFPGIPDDTIVGIPDLLIANNGSYTIRDCKLSRHADEERHPEILRQMDLYGWLFQTTFGFPPVALEALLGDGTIATVPMNGGHLALQDLHQIRQTALQTPAPYSPVGWSKCNGCAYHDHCWEAARGALDIAVLPEVDQSAAETLHTQGTISIHDLLANYDATSLAAVQRPWGDHMQRIGSKAAIILQQARALRDNQVIQIAPLELNLGPDVVMFDLEGMPPHLEDSEKVYLWGLQVFGDRSGSYQCALADFGPQGDENGWNGFLQLAEQIFSDYGDIKFLHWATYETTKLRLYMNRYGDQNGIGQRVLDSCFDLLRVVKKALIFPLPSYSLKVIEQYIGYQRTMEDFGGEWSMAQYVKAVETEDTTLRNRVMSEIMQYNREDLEATWAVLEWLRKWQ
ncbi:MAG TPA: TM0106 family RecB-like putative nuclease [bacterium]